MSSSDGAVAAEKPSPSPQSGAPGGPAAQTQGSQSGAAQADPDLDDLFTRYKRLQQQLEFLEVQEEYIKDEQRNLKKEFLHAQEEVRKIGLIKFLKNRQQFCLIAPHNKQKMLD